MDARTTTSESGREANGQTHRVLLLADALLKGSDVVRELGAHVDDLDDVEVMVVSPALARKRIDQELGNIDETLPEAEERLTGVVNELREAGLSTAGMIGDADPLVALSDGLARYPADEIVVVSHVDRDAAPGEQGIWDRLESDYHQPVTELRIGGDDGTPGAPDVEAVRHAPAHERTREEEIRETRNFPPMKPRDVAGIVIGIVGTIALGMIAVAIGTDDDGNLTGRAAIVLLIAIGAFLLNVAHVIGLLFFESVRYHGIWEKLFARASMGITTIGLAIALILWLA